MTAHVHIKAEADPARREEFRAIARELGLDPDDRWVGGYVDYEWEHLRPVLAAYGLDPTGKAVLEFGCNYGASGIVLARLGAKVTGVDVDPDNIRLAKANIAMNGADAAMTALHVADTRTMPFEDGSFDLVIANSVLEYVAPDQLDEVMAEIYRVMKPGGQMLVLGTASRFAPREVHSRRWLVNYLPRVIDRMAGKDWQRGLKPWQLAGSLHGRFTVTAKDSWIAARSGVHGKPTVPVRLVNRLARITGCAPGWLSPNIELLLQRV